MARPSKLSQEQCDRIRMLKDEGTSAPQLAKRFKMSESSVYKILNGSYVAAPAGTPPMAGQPEDLGSTPSIFTKARPENQASSRVRQAANNSDQPIDEITLAAAELIVAQARYAQARSHNR